MRKIMSWKSILGGVALALAAVSAAAPAAAQALDEIIKRGKVQVGVNLDGAPWGYIDGSGQTAGADIDSAKLLAKDLGVEIELVPVTAPNRIPYLLTRKVDLIVSTFSITAERAKTIAFTNPYGSIRVSLFAPRDIKLTAAADLAGRRVGVTRGSTAEQALTRMAPKEAQIVRYDDDGTTTTAFASGQVEIIALADIGGEIIAKQHPARNFERKLKIDETFYAIGLRRGDPDLLRWLNTWIFLNRTNGKLGAIHQAYFNEPLPDLPVF